MPSGVNAALISAEVAEVLERHGIAPDPYLYVVGAEELWPTVVQTIGPERTVRVSSVEELVAGVRSNRMSGVLVGAAQAVDVLTALSRSNQTIGVVVYDPDLDDGGAAALRSRGVMEIVVDPATTPWGALLRRVIDYRALLVLELQHRCEAKRLAERELELLGQPPESMSDDLTTSSPPPLPVGPMSIYNLEEASEAFEGAYIDRVQQLCNSAREAAEYLNVSSATLSRRMRREAAHGA